jgi:NADH-quinone oxidoreductase subunit N
LVVLGVGVAVLLGVVAMRRGHGLASGVAAAALVAGLAVVPWAMRATSQAMPALFDFSPDALGFCGLIILASLLILAIGFAYLTADFGAPREEFSILLFVATFGAVAMAGSAGFISLFLGLETMTLAMIGMIAYPKFRPAAEEAGLKYLVLSGMSSALILFGMGLIELSCDQLGFGALLAMKVQPMELAGLALMAAGAGFKLSVVPFHIWVPDVYAGAPAPAGAYVAVVAKIAVLAVVIRLLGAHGLVMSHEAVVVMGAVAVLSMLMGNLLALMQENLKRILGYSSIAHLGYLLVAILAAGSIGRIAVMFYLVTYSLTMIAAFGVVAILSRAGAARDVDQIADLRALFWTRPALAAVMTLVLLSLAGIPPAIGFIAKIYVFAAGVHNNLWVLTAVMIASSVIGLFYYLNIIIVMLQKQDAGRLPVLGGSVYGRLSLAIVSLPMIAFGVAPEPLIAMLKAVFG